MQFFESFVAVEMADLINEFGLNLFIEGACSTNPLNIEAPINLVEEVPGHMWIPSQV